MKDFTQEIVEGFVIETIFKEYMLKVSDEQIDPFIKNMIKEYLAQTERHNPKDTWNLCKELLDQIVHGALATSFEITLLDFEPYYLPPEGGYNHADGSINECPWRQKHSH